MSLSEMQRKLRNKSEPPAFPFNFQGNNNDLLKQIRGTAYPWEIVYHLYLNMQLWKTNGLLHSDLVHEATSI